MNAFMGHVGSQNGPRLFSAFLVDRDLVGLRVILSDSTAVHIAEPETCTFALDDLGDGTACDGRSQFVQNVIQFRHGLPRYMVLGTNHINYTTGQHA